MHPRAKLLHQVHGQHVQRSARHVHHLVAEHLLVVLDHQRVGELQREAPAVLIGDALEPWNQVQGLIELQVVLECRWMQLDLAVAQHVVQQVADLFLAEQRGVELDADVAPHLYQQEGNDAFDFPGGAPVKGGETDRVADAGGKGQVAVALEFTGKLGAQRFDLRGGVAHGLNPGTDARGAHAFEVVAHAHVEDRVEEIGAGRR